MQEGASTVLFVTGFTNTEVYVCRHPLRLVGHVARALGTSRHSRSKTAAAAYASSKCVVSFCIFCVQHGRIATICCRPAYSCIYRVYAMAGARSVACMCVVICRTGVRGPLLEASFVLGRLPSKRFGTHTAHGSIGTGGVLEPAFQHGGAFSFCARWQRGAA